MTMLADADIAAAADAAFTDAAFPGWREQPKQRGRSFPGKMWGGTFCSKPPQRVQVMININNKFMIVIFVTVTSMSTHVMIFIAQISNLSNFFP